MKSICCSSSVIIMAMALIAGSTARLSRQSNFQICDKGKRIIILSPGDSISINGSYLHDSFNTTKKCNLILQTENVNSTINIRCSSVGVKYPIKMDNCSNYLQINTIKYCLQEMPNLQARYDRVKLKLVTRRQLSSSGFSCSAEVPILKNVNTKDESKLRIPGCRCGKMKYTTRIVNGVETRVRSHPWVVAIVDSLMQQPFCGGSLINDRFVMTASHCFTFLDRLFPGVMQKVLLLEHIIGIPDGEQSHSIKRILVHPKYSTFIYGNDVALIELWVPVNFKKSEARPVCLPSPGNLFANVKATVLGWGMSKWNSPTSPVLKEVDIPTISKEKCNKIYSGFTIKDSMICAGYENRGTGGCLGDSGGPLMIRKDEHYTQIGILSFATDGAAWARFGCSAATGYTRVTSVLDWVKQTSKSGVTCPL